MPAHVPGPSAQMMQSQQLGKAQVQELVHNLTTLAATSEQKAHGLRLMGQEFDEEPSVLRWNELFGEKFTSGMWNWLAATLATEELQHQGVMAQLGQYQQVLRHMESGLVLPDSMRRG